MGREASRQCRHSFFRAQLRGGQVRKTCQDCARTWTEPAPSKEGKR